MLLFYVVLFCFVFVLFCFSFFWGHLFLYVREGSGENEVTVTDQILKNKIFVLLLDSLSQDSKPHFIFLFKIHIKKKTKSL